MALEIVEVLDEFMVHDYRVRVGARVMAWRRPDASWVVSFNGNDVPVPDGTVGPVGSSAATTEAKSVYSAARLEQYQVAPAKPA